jgi:probable rRNA maturation factor
MTVAVANRQRRRRIVPARWQRWAKQFPVRLQNLSVVFVSDRLMRRLNHRYHGRSAATDVLTFDYGAGNAEVIISVDTAVRQARRFGSTPRRELALYLIHGLLHLHGYDDRTPAQRRRMRAAERRWLRRAGLGARGVGRMKT